MDMPNQQLVSYIQEQLRRGYDINTIKTYLTRYGYNPADVEEAANYVYAPKKKMPVLVFVIIGIIILLLISIGLFSMLRKPETKETSLSMNTEMMSKRIVAGGYILFKTEIEKEGPGRVRLTHELNGQDGSTISEIDEITSKSKATQMKLPADADPGIYTIETNAVFDDITRTSTISFTLESGNDTETETGIERQCPDSCNDFNECTDDYCSEQTNYECINEKITPCCGNGICEPDEQCAKDCIGGNEDTAKTDDFDALTIWEKVDAIKGIAEDNPIQAKAGCDDIGVASHRNQCYYNIAEITGVIDYCDLITDQKIKDRCYTKVAEISGNNKICDSLSTESRRDNCYMTFVQTGDYSVCGKLVNKYYKESCEALQIMETIPDYSNYEVPEPE